jgi:hypothetical protein
MQTPIVTGHKFGISVVEIRECPDDDVMQVETCSHVTLSLSSLQSTTHSCLNPTLVPQLHTLIMGAAINRYAAHEDGNPLVVANFLINFPTPLILPSLVPAPLQIASLFLHQRRTRPIYKLYAELANFWLHNSSPQLL